LLYINAHKRYTYVEGGWGQLRARVGWC